MKSLQDPEGSEHADAGAVDVDPWIDFLSESSDELDLLKTELLTVPDPTDGVMPRDDAPAEIAAAPPPARSLPANPPKEFAREAVSVVVLEAVPGPPASPPAGDTATEASPVGSCVSTASEPIVRAPAAPEGLVPVAPAPEEQHPAQEILVTPPLPDARLMPAAEDAGLTPVASDALVTAAVRHAPVTDAEPAPADDATTGITIADVLARQVPVRWSEAVAVIEELCEVLAREGTTAIPDARHVRITSGGTLVVAAGGRREREISALGRMLHALLSTATTPLPLRLFVTSSISSPRIESVESYGDALSHYAAYTAPDRRGAVQALCRRALEAPVLPQVRRISQPAIRIDARPGLAGSPAHRRRALQAAVVVLAIAGSMAAGTWIGRTAEPVAPRQVPASSPPAVAAMPRAVTWVPPAATASDPWELGLVAVPRGSVSTPQGRAPRVEPAPMPVPATPLVLPPVPPSLQVPAPPTEVAALTPPSPPAQAPDAGAALTAAGPVGIGRPAGTEPHPEDPLSAAYLPDTVYSSDDADVEPPVVLSDGALTPAPALPGSAPRTPIELLINKSGDVERVHYLDAPEVLTDVSWLQSVKYQKFRPAMKDGLPVLYRLLVR